METGCAFAEEAVLVVGEDQSSIRAFEHEDWEKKGCFSNPVLAFSIVQVADVHCQQVISKHQRFHAGCIRLTGTFDNDRGEEMLTFKQPTPAHNKLKNTLRDLCDN